MLYYSIDHPDPDNNFTVTVVPINGARVASNMFMFVSELHVYILSTIIIIVYYYL